MPQTMCATQTPQQNATNLSANCGALQAAMPVSTGGMALCIPRVHCVQVATVTVLEVNSTTPDPRIATWQGQQLVVLLCADDNCNAYQNGTAGELFRAAALAEVTKMDYCALAEDNVITMKVGGCPGAPAGLHPLTPQNTQCMPNPQTPPHSCTHAFP